MMIGEKACWELPPQILPHGCLLSQGRGGTHCSSIYLLMKVLTGFELCGTTTNSLPCDVHNFNAWKFFCILLLLFDTECQIGSKNDWSKESIESEAEQDLVEQESNAMLLSRGALATSTPREFIPGSESSNGNFDADNVWDDVLLLTQCHWMLMKIEEIFLHLGKVLWFWIRKFPRDFSCCFSWFCCLILAYLSTIICNHYCSPSWEDSMGMQEIFFPHRGLQQSMQGKYEWNKVLWSNEELHMMATRLVGTWAYVKGQT